MPNTDTVKVSAFAATHKQYRVTSIIEMPRRDFEHFSYLYRVMRGDGVSAKHARMNLVHIARWGERLGTKKVQTAIDSLQAR
jgi:hypothetical protein